MAARSTSPPTCRAHFAESLTMLGFDAASGGCRDRSTPRAARQSARSRRRPRRGGGAARRTPRARIANQGETAMNDDDALWRRRLLAYSAVRLAGLAVFFLGIVIIYTDLVRAGGWPRLGAVIAIMGAIDAVFAPRLLKKVWDQQSESEALLEGRRRDPRERWLGRQPRRTAAAHAGAGSPRSPERSPGARHRGRVERESRARSIRATCR